MRSISSILVALALLANALAADLAVPLSLTVLKAEVGTDAATGGAVLTITFDPASTEALAAFTSDNVGSRTVVRVEGEEIMDPIIREPILQGVVQVNGEWTKEDLEAVARRLAEGATIEVEIFEDQPSPPARPTDT